MREPVPIPVPDLLIGVAHDVSEELVIGSDVLRWVLAEDDHVLVIHDDLDPDSHDLQGFAQPRVLPLGDKRHLVSKHDDTVLVLDLVPGVGQQVAVVEVAVDDGCQQFDGPLITLMLGLSSEVGPDRSEGTDDGRFDHLGPPLGSRALEFPVKGIAVGVVLVHSLDERQERAVVVDVPVGADDEVEAGLDGAILTLFSLQSTSTGPDVQSDVSWSHPSVPVGPNEGDVVTLLFLAEDLQGDDGKSGVDIHVHVCENARHENLWLGERLGKVPVFARFVNRKTHHFWCVLSVIGLFLRRFQGSLRP